MISTQYWEQNEVEYKTDIGVVYLTFIFPLYYSKLDLNIPNFEQDLYTNYLAKFQKSKGEQSFN